jgi:hypothetical protein
VISTCRATHRSGDEGTLFQPLDPTGDLRLARHLEPDPATSGLQSHVESSGVGKPGPVDSSPSDWTVSPAQAGPGCEEDPALASGEMTRIRHPIASDMRSFRTWLANCHRDGTSRD